MLMCGKVGPGAGEAGFAIGELFLDAIAEGRA